MTKRERIAAIYRHDLQLWEQGLVFGGIDEAGRGPLAGHVTAACVVMPLHPCLPYVYDSKQLSEKQRNAVYEDILKHALYVGVGRAEPEEIDDINILEATKLAMRRAAQGAGVGLFLIDAVTRVGLPGREQAIISGDAVSYSIAAASIVAKVTRDREMAELHTLYPQYHFDTNKGYGTREHVLALKEFGPCPCHRCSFLGKILQA